MDDVGLIERTLAGDHDAFGDLVRRHADVVHGMVLRACGDPDSAAELTQETFLKALAGLRGFDRARPLRPWLLTVALNAVRSAQRTGRVRAGIMAEDGDDHVRQAPDHAPGPEETAALGQRDRRLEAMVRQLPDKLREAVALRFWADLSFAELAEALEVSESAAKMRVYRALEQLRLLMDGERHDG